MRNVARVALAVCAATLPFVCGVGVAHADVESRLAKEFTFTQASTGQSVTCTVEGYSIVYGASTDPRREAFASTRASGASNTCSDGSASLALAYQDNNGTDVHSGAAGEQSTYWTADNIGQGSPSLVAEHSFVFADCASNCSLTFFTAPK